MKVAITGKGGVGKTTLSSTLARLYADEGRTVLAADVDPDANLGLALGLTEEEVNAELERMAKQYGLEADKLREIIGEANLSMIEGDIKVRKAVDMMYDSAVKK